MIFRLYLMLTLGYLIFIGIASFYITGENTLNNLKIIDSIAQQDWSSIKVVLHNLRDISTNILLYIPLGFFLIYLRSIRSKQRLLCPLFFLGFFVSLCVEVIQLFVGRYADPVDILSNGIGYSIGFTLGYIAIYRYQFTAEALLGITGESEIGNVLAAIRFLYISVFIVVQLLPLDITVSMGDLYSKLLIPLSGDPRIILDPFYHFQYSFTGLHEFVLRFLAFIPVAVLTYFLAAYRSQNVIYKTLFVCVSLSVVAEVFKVFIKSAQSDVFTIILALFAAYAVIVIFKFKKMTNIRNEGRTEDSWFLFALIIYLLFLTVFAWSPYEYEMNFNFLIEKVRHGSNFIPFRAHFSHRSVGSAIDLGKEFILIVPFGFLLALHFLKGKESVLSMFDIGIRVFLVCFLLLTIIEFSQLMIVGRYVDVTDILLGISGGLFGSSIYYNFKWSSLKRK